MMYRQYSYSFSGIFFCHKFVLKNEIVFWLKFFIFCLHLSAASNAKTKVHRELVLVSMDSWRSKKLYASHFLALSCLLTALWEVFYLVLTCSNEFIQVLESNYRLWVIWGKDVWWKTFVLSQSSDKYQSWVIWGWGTSG